MNNLTTALFDEIPTPRMLEIAHVIDTWTDYTAVLHRAEAYEACTEAQRQGLRPCVLRAGRHVFPRERPVRVTDGLGIVIDVPLLFNDEEWNTYVRPRIEQWPEFVQQPQPDAENDDDHVALMARRPRARGLTSSGSSRSTSSTDTSTASVPSHIDTAAWRRTVVFPFDGAAISCLLPDEPGPEQLYQIGLALPGSQGDVATAHIVSEKPEDLVAMDLDCMLVTKAHQMRPNPFMRLVLLDLEIFEENDILPGAFQRSAKWMPHTATRLSLFRILCLENIFMLHADKTSLWINNILIDSAANDALTIEDGDYIKIFIGNDEYCFQCTEDQDTMALLQTAITQAISVMQDQGHQAASFAECKTHTPTSVCQIDDRPETISLSFTDEFLRAVEAMRTAADAMPEFPEDDPGDITAYDPWVQRLHEAWTRAATIGPGGMERLGRVETWFTDHANFQRCHHTRIAVLGPDAHRWEEQLRHLWRQYLLLGAPLEFHMVEPTPEDASGQIIGQLLLVQRPHVYQRSVVISTYDNEYDQGRAHSTAVVMGTRVDLHSVCTMMQAHEDCPPENPENRCTLWSGLRPMEPRERVYARHGSLFKLVIQRALHANVAAASGTNLRERMRAIDARVISGHMISGHTPLWLQALHRVFQDLAETERTDEGPVAYVATWYLHASYAPRCEPGRTVRLRDDPLNWQRTLSEAWGDRYDSSRPADLFWISPAPPSSLTDHVLGHILIVQALPAHSVATLLTARVRDQEGQTLRRVAACIPQASSAEDIVAAFPIPGPLLRYPRRVGRGQTFFDPNTPTQVASGEGLVIDIIDTTLTPPLDTNTEGINLLQTHVHRTRQPIYSSLRDKHAIDERRCLTVGQVAHTQRPSSQDAKQIICLEETIPVSPKIQVDFKSVQQVLEVIHAAVNEFLQAWPDELELPQVTQDALSGLISAPDEVPLALHFYTDGSKIPEGAVGAGIVLLTESQQGLSYGGALCKVITPEGHAGAGENGAVIWALLWALQLGNHLWTHYGAADIHFYFHFDALNAGYLAGGYFRTKQFPHHRTLMRSLAHILQGRHGLSRMHWRHVKAHAGNPWNELADTIAKFASQHPEQVPHSELWHAWLQDPVQLLAVQWVWYLEQMQAECPHAPQLRNGFLECNLTQVPQAPPEDPVHQTPDAHLDSALELTQIDITIATANVLTLRTEDCPQQGTSISRQFVIMQQFHDAGCIFVGIQETRHKHLAGINNPWYHVLGHPATPQGQDGIQLWISSCIPLSTTNALIRREHIRIVYSCPTTLIAKVNIGTWKCVVVTSRAPHSGRPRHEALSHWSAITTALHRKAAGWPIFFCGDANAHVGGCPTTAVGDLAPAQENQAGELFHHWLLAHNLKLPATFAESHYGLAHHSYHSPDGKHGTRIDYVAVPQETQYDTLNSWIAEDIDLSVLRTDHHAVLCHCSFAVPAPSQRRMRKKPVWDSHFLSQQLLQEDVLYTLHSAVPSIPWYVDPHVAASQLAHYTTVALQQVARPRKTWRRKSHISDNTWALIEHKKFHFKHLRQLTRTWRLTTLQACFLSWKKPTSTGTSGTSTVCQDLQRDLPHWKKLHDFAVAQTTRQYRQAAQQAKQAIQEEDLAYYQNLACQATHTYSVEGLAGVWKHFRAILPKNKSKRHMIQHDLGPSLLQHFQTLEAGVSFECQQLRHQCIQRNNKEIGARPLVQQIDLQELPTLVEIEDHCLKQRPHKATGPDGVPSSLCRTGSVAIAPHLHSLVCKSFLLGIEPFPHKGGHLCALFKHKGSRDDAAAYRGILLSDSFAKITHAWTRQKLLPTLQARRTIGQLGGLPSQQTLTGIQILRLHGSVSHAAQLSTCTIFLDLRSAFHHLLRELVFLTSDGLTERDLEQIFHQDDFDIPALATKIATLTATHRDDIPPGLQRFLHDIHHQTWFQLRDASDLHSGTCTHTRRGSRPKSPLADIAFNLLMAELLQDLHDTRGPIEQ